MAESPNIPKQRQITTSTKLIIQSFALGTVKTELYKAGMPKENGQGKSYGVSRLGTPVFSNLDITGFSYTDNSGKQIDVPSINFDTVLFTVNQQKNIITTDLQGRNSSVKEYISDKDFQIEIMGVLNAENRNFPLEELQDLIALLKAPVSFKINSWYLDLFGISNLVVMSYDIGQQEGMYSNQSFSMSCLSDVPIELQIVQ